MKNNTIDVLNIFKIPLSRFKNLKTDTYIRFEDNVVELAKARHLIVFRYLMDFVMEFHIPITSDLWIDRHLSNGVITQKTYLKMYSAIYKKVATTHVATSEDMNIIITMFRRMYETMGVVNSELLKDIVAHSVAVEATDILEIQFHDDLLLAIADASRNPSNTTVKYTYEVLHRIMTAETYSDNVIRLFYLSGVVSLGQLRQLLGSRGYVTEIDSSIFNTPMTNSFALGFKGIYDAAIESRAGAKALYLSGTAIQNSEYMARELQLAIMVVESVVIGSCDNPTYVDYYVRPREVNATGEEVYKGDLTNIVGKYYLTVEGEEKVVTSSSTELNGTFIRMRVATYCSLPNKKHICSKCLGDISYSIMPSQNLGHITSIHGSAMITQALLSTKHLLATATSAVVNMSAIAKKYFMVKAGEMVMFKANVINKKTKNVYIKIEQREAWGLSTASKVNDILSINVNKVSRLTSMTLVIEGKNDNVEVEIPLKIGSRHAMLSLEAISYIITNGYKTPDENTYLIDINDFDPKKPLLVYDKVEFDFKALTTEFKRLLKTREYKKVNGVMRSEYTPHILVQKLFELVNNKLSVNIAIFEVMVYAFTARDITGRNYDLGRNSKHRDVVGFKEAINYRSIGASYDWDDLKSKVLDPMSFAEENRVAHPMDVFFKPNEVLANETES